MSRTISLASYLFRRLQQHGVDHVFGVPGDFTLKALDHLKAAGPKWIGTCNELNAGYAADGYSRINGLGALFTTYGVGELSAINAVAGSYAEHVPVIHVVGLPQGRHIHSGSIVHHTLGNGQNGIFKDMHSHVTTAQVLLEEHENVTASVDNAIQQALVHSRPAYIAMPCDMVAKDVKAGRLDESLLVDAVDVPQAQHIYGRVRELLQTAKQPLLLIDRGMGLDTPELRSQLNDFVRVSGIPTLTLPSGAGMVDHSITNYFGVHAGPVGQIDTMPYLNSADLVLTFGPMFSDTQTLGWTVVPSRHTTVTIGKDSIQFFDEEQRNPITLPDLLQHLTKQLDMSRFASIDTSTLSNFRQIPSPTTTSLDEPINQTSLYLRLNSYLRPKDTILLGNATPILGGRDFVLPDPSCRVIASGLWFSIGHMLPAALGAAMAQQRTSKSPNPSGRTILFDGDGSFQVTAQELSTIIHQRLNITIFILNNAGYAYERLIHNPLADYHDVAPWNYLALPAVFGAEAAVNKARDAGETYSVDTYTMRTWRDLENFLHDERFDNGQGGRGQRGLKLVDVRVGRADVPEKFKAVFESAGRNLG